MMKCSEYVDYDDAAFRYERMRIRWQVFFSQNASTIGRGRDLRGKTSLTYRGELMAVNECVAENTI